MAAIPSGFTASLFAGVQLFPGVSTPEPTPAALAGGGRYRYQIAPKTVADLPPSVVVPTSFKKVKHYPTIELVPYTATKLTQKISVDHILKPRVKSTKLQDILDDDEEILMLI